MILPYAVQPNAVRPFPAVPAFGVDNSAIVEVEEKLAGIILDIDKMVDQTLNRIVDGIVVEAVNLAVHYDQGRLSM